MKSIELEVPRAAIKEFFKHPELDGDFVVTLKNDMYTDVFYDELGEFRTITNDEELIDYLKKETFKKTEYFYRNGVFSFRTVNDGDKPLLKEWSKINNSNLPIRKEVHISTNHTNKKYDIFPEESIFMFYWIEVGLVHKRIINNDLIFVVYIYDNQFMDGTDVDTIDIILKELIN